MLASAGVAYSQLANTGHDKHDHQGHKHTCTDENCTHTHHTDTVPAFSMYYFPDSTSTDVIDISVEPVVNSPEAVAYHQLHKTASKSQVPSARKLEDAVMTAEQFVTTMNTLGAGDPLSHIPVQVQVNTTKTVGAIPIETSVSPIGGVTYNVPIACTPGRKGHQPNIGISYNSSGGKRRAGIRMEYLGSVSYFPYPAEHPLQREG